MHRRTDGRTDVILFGLHKTRHMCPNLVTQGVSARLTGHILEALLPQGELKE